ncbi:MAG: hypothetical protein JXR77_12065 [Lentisphaeria bacterium]|nr:hypothetical protein [Lentisphaeria bacterium]
MKTRHALVLALLCCLWAPLAAQDGAVLSARLVTAGSGNAREDPRLGDVLPLLKSTLRFSSFQLEGEATLSLRENAVASLAKDYRVTLTEVTGPSALVHVSRREEKMLQTRLTLKPERPVIVGGFDEAGGSKAIIILKLR